MIIKTSAILLHTIRYGDSSMIAHMYTRQAGRMAFMLHTVKSRRGSVRASMLIPLTILHIEADVRDKRELQRIIEMKPALVFSSLPFDVVKSAIAMFIAELLYRLLIEHEPNTGLFDYLQTIIEKIDADNKLQPSFLLVFMVSLSGFLGIRPTGRFSSQTPVFDLLNGVFIASAPEHPHYLLPEQAHYLDKILLSSGDQTVHDIPKDIRNTLAEQLIRFFELHFEGIGNIRSYQVLSQVFKD